MVINNTAINWLIILLYEFVWFIHSLWEQKVVRVIEYLIKHPFWAPLSSSVNMHNNNQYHPHHHYHQEHHLPLSGGSKVSSYAMQSSFISFIMCSYLCSSMFFVYIFIQILKLLWNISRRRLKTTETKYFQPTFHPPNHPP